MAGSQTIETVSVPHSSNFGPRSYFVPAPAYINYVYAGTTAIDVTVPTGYKYVLFSATADFYARYDNTAAVPGTSDITTGTGSELNPTTRSLDDVTTVSIIAPVAATKVTLSFYKWP